MARLRRFIAAGINIALPPPHSPDRYGQLIQAIFDLRIPVQVRGDQHIMISSITKSEQVEDRIEGTLARFTEIDQNQPWFNLINLDEAEDGERKSIQIPDSLRPNYKPFLFYFDLKNHTFVFEHSLGSNTLGTASVIKFFTASVQHSSIVQKFGSVSISLIQSEDAMDKIFSLKKVKWLRISYNLPNPDDHASFEAIMQERLSNIDAKNVDMKFEGDARFGLNLDDGQIRALADSAKRNGKVEARGYDANDNLITASSEEHPKLKSESFDPEKTSQTHVLRHLANFFVRRT